MIFIEDRLPLTTDIVLPIICLANKQQKQAKLDIGNRIHSIWEKVFPNDPNILQPRSIIEKIRKACDNFRKQVSQGK